MPSFETLIVVIIAGLTLSASPGPSMLYVLSRSLGQSRNAGLVSAAGLATGGMLHAVGAALGLSVVFGYVPFAYPLLQGIGALYLIYLGVQMARSQTVSFDNLETVTRQPLGTIYFQGVLVEALNPKTVLFFVAFIPQFVDPERGAIPLQMLILGMLVPLTAIPSDILVSFTGGSLARRVSDNPKLQATLKWTSALFLFGLGIHLGTGMFENVPA